MQAALVRSPVRFRVLSPLGVGTRGLVFLAEVIGAPRRLVTVKEVAIAAPDAGALERIDRLLDRLAALRHDALLPFLDGEVSDAGRLRLVADYVVGSALDVYLRRELPPIGARVRLLAGVCRAVAFSHRHGFTHGHLRSSDALVSVRDGAPRVRIRDVGLPELIGLAPDPTRDLIDLAYLGDLVVAGADPTPTDLADLFESLRHPAVSRAASTADQVAVETAAAADRAAAALDHFA
jgi:serine/threonine protein kinase